MTVCHSEPAGEESVPGGERILHFLRKFAFSSVRVNEVHGHSFRMTMAAFMTSDPLVSVWCMFDGRKFRVDADAFRTNLARDLG